ncbi:unnamed protein product [Brassica rapa subsp. trilocularis]
MVRDLSGYGDESVNGCDFIPSNHVLRTSDTDLISFWLLLLLSFSFFFLILWIQWFSHLHL